MITQWKLQKPNNNYEIINFSEHYLFIIRMIYLNAIWQYHGRDKRLWVGIPRVNVAGFIISRSETPIRTTEIPMIYIMPHLTPLIIVSTKVN